MKTAYRPELDGLRAIAVLMVLFYHTQLGWSGGFVGVDVFFVLSGFLITRQILGERVQQKFRLRSFWLRRIRRLLPAAVVVVATVMIAGHFLLLPRDYQRLGESVLSQQLLLANVDAWRHIGYFELSADLQPLLHMWSLAVEEQFYLLFPLLFCFRRIGNRGLFVLLLSLFLISLAGSAWGIRFSPSATFYLLPTRAWELVCGALVCFLPPLRGRSEGYRGLSAAVSLLGILGCGWCFGTVGSFPGPTALLPCVAAAVLIYQTDATGCVTSRLLSSRLLVLIGKISYSLYLWHWPLLAFARYWADGELTLMQRLLLLAVSFLLATISWLFIEQPFRRRDPASGAWQIATRRLLLCCGSGVVFCLVGGGVVGVTSGLPSRVSPAVLRLHMAAESRGFLFEVSPEAAAAAEFPACGSPGGQQTCLMWGDSHAMSLMPGLDAACQEAEFLCWQATHSATPPLLEYVPTGGFGALAVVFNRDVVAAVERLRPDVTVLTAWWSGYARDPAFEDCLRKTLVALQRTGTRVILVRDIAAFTVDVPRVQALRLFSGRSASPMIISREQHDEVNRQADEVLTRVAGEFGTVELLDPAAVFCDRQGNWVSEIGDDVIYADSAHLTIAGGLRGRELFLPLLLKQAAAVFNRDGPAGTTLPDSRPN